MSLTPSFFTQSLKKYFFIHDIGVTMILILLATLTLMTLLTPSQFYAEATPQLDYCIVLKRYHSKSVLFKKWELLEITKRCPKPFSVIPLIALIKMFISSKLFVWHLSRRIVRMESAEKWAAIYRKKPSHDWLEKDQWESVISVQSLSCIRILFVGRGRG